MRVLGLAVLLVTAGLAGCLQQGEEIRALQRENASEPSSANGSAADTNASARSSTADSANGTVANRTVEDPGDGNGTEPAPEPESVEAPPTLPGNLSMQGAEVVERTSQHVVFAWNASVQPGPDDTSPVVTTSFDVPKGIPLLVNASLSWSNRSDLDLFVDKRHVRAYCASVTTAVTADGREACQVRTLARSSWDAWNVTVAKGQLRHQAPSAPTSFSVELRVTVADPWTGSPVETQASPGGARADPGWPSLEDATIRPGAKIGVGGAGTNFGTANFVFSSPDNRTLYLGWIAHGVLGMEPGDTLRLPASGVEATLVYCSWGAIEETVTCPYLSYAPERASPPGTETHPRFFNDFALFRLPADARDQVHPATLVWGGPTGIGDPPSLGTQVVGLGNTPFRDGGQTGVNALDALTGVAGSSNEVRTQVDLVPQPVGGDSGSPILRASGQAVGVISAIDAPVVGAEPSPDRAGPGSGNTIVPNLGHVVGYMERNTALDVELETWPTFETPRAEDVAGAPTNETPTG